MAFLPTFSEVDSSLGNLHVRQDLTNHSVTVAFKPWHLWDWDTEQIQMTNLLLHFVEPDGTVAGIKVLGGQN